MEIKVNNSMPMSHIDNRQALKVFNQKGIITVGTAGDEGLLKMSNSAPMITTPNINANLGVLNYIDPESIEVLTAVQTADMIAKPKKIGYWGLNSYTFNIKERMGRVSPDDGSVNNVTRSTTNNSQILRGCKAFAGYWGANDIEKAQYSQMKIDIQAEDVKSLMQALAINRNMVFFNGVKETWQANKDGVALPIYGFTNDPYLPAYEVVAPNETGISTTWDKKTPNEISNDVCVLAYGRLNKKSGGLTNTGITNRRGRLVMVVSNSSYTLLSKMQTVGTSWISAKMLIEQNLPGIEIIASPELDGINNGEDVFYLFYEEDAYGSTIDNLYIEMARAYPIFVKHSEISQKISQLIAGCVVRIPMFIVRYTGIHTSTPIPAGQKQSYYN